MAVAGDVPALVTVAVDNDEVSADYWWLVWGLRSRYYDSAASAALYFEAESRTAMGGSATAAGPSGASGAGSNVMRNTALATSFQAILGTQASGGGAHLSHIGNYRVFARVQTATANTGVVSVALEWSEGDFHRTTRNPQTAFPVDRWDGTWRLVDLGQVHLTKATAGVQRWEGRILARSTVAGDDIDVDCLMFVPIDEGYGEVSALVRIESPTSFVARDEFEQTTGNLTGKVMPVGGTWAGAGDADDWSIRPSPSFPPIVHRGAMSDLGGGGPSGRFGLAGTGTLAGVVVQADVRAIGGVTARTGVFARYVDTNNFVVCGMCASGMSGTVNPTLFVERYVAGALTTMGSVVLPATVVATGWWTLRLQVDAAGRWWCWAALQSVPVGATPPLQPAPFSGAPVLSGQDAVLATGGALATGRYGILDWETGAGGADRQLDNFIVFAPTSDAAIFAGQSLELRSDRVIREDPTGAVWQPVSSYEGSFPKVPAGGREGRSVRWIIVPSRHDPRTAPHDFGDLSFRATVVPRFLQVPA